MGKVTRCEASARVAAAAGGPLDLAPGTARLHGCNGSLAPPLQDEQIVMTNGADIHASFIWGCCPVRSQSRRST